MEIERAARILKDAGIATELAPTAEQGNATKIAREAVERRRGMVIACGGDGTINEIVNGLAGSQVPMALLPAGTEMVMPGDNVAISVELITPIAMEKELRFAIREGGRTVGAGVVAEIVE